VPSTAGLNGEQWVDLTLEVFGPDGYVLDELQRQVTGFRVFSANDENIFAFRSQEDMPRLLHAVYNVQPGWICCCTHDKPCIAEALLQLRDAVQPFMRLGGRS
jgi:hypothetical protein